jgi:hypothetical protein
MAMNFIAEQKGDRQPSFPPSMLHWLSRGRHDVKSEASPHFAESQLL